MTPNLKMDYRFGFELKADKDTTINLTLDDEVVLENYTVTTEKRPLSVEILGLPAIARDGSVVADFNVNVADDAVVDVTVMGYLNKWTFAPHYRFISTAPEYDIYQQVEGRKPGTNLACGVEAKESDFLQQSTYLEYNKRHGVDSVRVEGTDNTIKVSLDFDVMRG